MLMYPPLFDAVGCLCTRDHALHTVSIFPLCNDFRLHFSPDAIEAEDSQKGFPIKSLLRNTRMGFRVTHTGVKARDRRGPSAEGRTSA